MLTARRGCVVARWQSRRLRGCDRRWLRLDDDVRLGCGDTTRASGTRGVSIAGFGATCTGGGAGTVDVTIWSMGSSQRKSSGGSATATLLRAPADELSRFAAVGLVAAAGRPRQRPAALRTEPRRGLDRRRTIVMRRGIGKFVALLDQADLAEELVDRVVGDVDTGEPADPFRLLAKMVDRRSGSDRTRGDAPRARRSARRRARRRCSC